MIEYDYNQYLLPNGITLVHKNVPYTKMVHCGVMIDVGSRDENENEYGLVHLWEHMAFKGTKKRSSIKVATYLDALGGELNAYTTKEKICFHASVLDKHFRKAVDLLADITFNSTFPDKELKKEKEVILEEMAMYLDSPEDNIQDEFEQLLFQDHPLAHNILGESNTFAQYSQQNLTDFINSKLGTSNMVISVVGNVSFKDTINLVSDYFLSIDFKSTIIQRSKFDLFKNKDLFLPKALSQTHIAIGGMACSLNHEDRISTFLLFNLLGGSAMNAILNLNLREKKGMVYGIDASYTPFTDCGYFSIYFACDQKKAKKSMEIVSQTLENIQNKLFTEKQLLSYKEQLKAQMAMSEENNMAIMLMLAKATLEIGKIESINQTFEYIDKINPEKILSLSKSLFHPSNISKLIYQQ